MRESTSAITKLVLDTYESTLILQTNVDPSDRASLCIRKMMLAMVAIDRIKQASAIGIGKQCRQLK